MQIFAIEQVHIRMLLLLLLLFSVWMRTHSQAGGCLCVRGVVAVTVGGASWSSFNTTAETVDFSATQLAAAGMVEKLQSIVVKY